MKKGIITWLCLILMMTAKAQLFQDDFHGALDTLLWKAEIAPVSNSRVYTDKGALILDTKGGVTVWLNKSLSGNFIIEYKREVLIGGGANDRLSDLNNFWMAHDPRNADLFTRQGILEQYDSLQLYYVGMGGNTNTTTRFRKYDGTGQRKLLGEFKDTAHLLQPNKEYTIRIIVNNGTTSYWVDGVKYFEYTDPQPLQSGYFGFRSTWSRQAIRDFKIYQIK